MAQIFNDLSFCFIINGTTQICRYIFGAHSITIIAIMHNDFML